MTHNRHTRAQAAHIKRQLLEALIWLLGLEHPSTVNRERSEQRGSLSLAGGICPSQGPEGRLLACSCHHSAWGVRLLLERVNNASQPASMQAEAHGRLACCQHSFSTRFRLQIIACRHMVCPGVPRGPGAQDTLPVCWRSQARLTGMYFPASASCQAKPASQPAPLFPHRACGALRQGCLNLYVYPRALG